MTYNPSSSHFMLYILATILIAAFSFSHAGGIPNSDDLLREVSVKDLLGGQSWFDPYQYRLGVDGGTMMHWSRLVDAPIAIIYWLAEKVTGNSAMSLAVVKVA